MPAEITIRPDADAYTRNQKAFTGTYFSFFVIDTVAAIWSALLYLTYHNVFAAVYFLLCLILTLIHGVMWVRTKKKRKDLRECVLTLTEDVLSGVIWPGFGMFQEINIKLAEVDRMTETEDAGFILCLKEDAKVSTVIEQNTKLRNVRYITVKGDGYGLAEFKELYNRLSGLVPVGASSGGAFWKTHKAAAIWNYLLPLCSVIPALAAVLFAYL